MEALSKVLLQVDCTAAVTPAHLSTLTPAQLAIAALRPDLDILTRQRAYHAFLEHRRALEAAPGSAAQSSLLDLPLDFAIPASLYSLSAAQLILLQFNPRCASTDEAGDAAALFLQLASEAARDDQEADEQKPSAAPADLDVESCELRWDGGRREETSGLSLKVEESALAVVREARTLFRIEAKDITDFRYLAGADDGRAAMECTLSLDAAHVALNPIVSVRDVTATIALGMLNAKDDHFVQLRASVSRWSDGQGFKVAVQQSSNRTTPFSVTKRVPTPSIEDKPRKKARRSERSRELEAVGEGVWTFVGETPAEAEWHPGAFVRQIALLQAIAPTQHLAFPEFGPDELAVLSRKPVVDKLPKLPPYPPDPAPGRRYLTVERLALEYIYHRGTPISLPADRLVLLTDEYPDLRDYAKVTSKLVESRDALKVAYEQVLNYCLYVCRTKLAAQTRDPVENLISLVRTMQDNPL
ncbi:hypothetical protein JCM10449v2_006988 [Rhodotorula kratochvilovae]